ncbi:MAG TPA: hypothetical protein VF942_14140 [Acidimicrobiales bacterium]
MRLHRLLTLMVVVELLAGSLMISRHSGPPRRRHDSHARLAAGSASGHPGPPVKVAPSLPATSSTTIYHGGKEPAASGSTTAALPARASSAGRGGSSGLPDSLWGVTLDDVSNTASIVSSLDAFPSRPMARVVFDENQHPADYTDAVQRLHPHAYLMGELLDSQYVSRYSVDAYARRAAEFVGSLGSQVDLWEVGNEVNGEWLGPTSRTVAKIVAAYDRVSSSGQRTALTLYYNPDCWSNPANEMFRWASTNLPARIKSGLDYVFISYYPEDCNNYWPSQATWQSVFDQLHQMFPAARLGFGESGNSNDQDPVSQKITLLHRYYRLTINGDGYVGGYFWWYYVEDALPYLNNPLWHALATDATAHTG